jgi:hypothetical protein
MPLLQVKMYRTCTTWLASLRWSRISTQKTLRYISLTKPLYILSELSQLTIQRLCTAHSWVMTSYPEKVNSKLPRDLFERLHRDEAAANMKLRFLGDSWASVGANAVKVRPSNTATKGVQNAIKNSCKAHKNGIS